MAVSIVQQKADAFAVRIVRAYININNKNSEAEK